MQHVVSLLFASLCYFLITRLNVFFKYYFSLFSCFVYLFSILCVLCFCVVLCIVSLSVYSCLSPIFVKVYRPLPQVGNPTTLKKSYHTLIIMMALYTVSKIVDNNHHPPKLIKWWCNQIRVQDVNVVTHNHRTWQTVPLSSLAFLEKQSKHKYVVTGRMQFIWRLLHVQVNEAITRRGCYNYRVAHEMSYHFIIPLKL